MNRTGIGTELRTEIINVTPAMAQEWLENHENYRAERKHRVSQYASAMARGEWQCPGPPLAFDRSGKLLDGQNRLSAVVMTGFTVPFVCLFGYEAKAASVFDRGLPRRHADTLAQEGFRDTNALSAALTRLYWLLLKRPDTMTLNPSYAQLRGVLEDHPGLIDACIRANNTALRTLVPRAWLSPAIYLCRRSDSEAADVFFEQLKTGANLQPGSPVKALRDRLLAEHGKHKRGLKAREKYALTIKAWNAFKAEREIKQLKWLDTEAMPEVE